MTQMNLFVDDMYKNLDKMLPRILDSLNKTNLDYIFSELDNIKGPTIVTGVGGSSVVGEFLAKVLNHKNHIIAEFKFPRELLLTDLSGYERQLSYGNCKYFGEQYIWISACLCGFPFRGLAF